MCKEVNVHQNCSVTNIIQNIFCLPQAKEIHPVLELFWVNYPFKRKPHPTDDFIGRLNQAATCQKRFRRFRQSLLLTKSNEIHRAEFTLNCFVKKKITQILQLHAVFNYTGNRRSN